MKIQNKPDYLIFADSAKKGEVSDFPDVGRGWGVTIEQTASKPPMEWMNGAFNRIDKNMLYLLQQGVPEWSENVKYPANAIIKYNGVLYTSIAENENSKPTTNTTKWTTVIENKYLPANKLDNEKCEVVIETNFKQRPKFNNNDMLSVTDYAGSLNESGYQKLPNGLIIQWLEGYNSVSTSGKVTLPIAFPNEVLYASFTDTLYTLLDDAQTSNIGAGCWGKGNSSKSQLAYMFTIIPGAFNVLAIGY